MPIVPDESRTFGMEGMFRQLGIFSQVGQLYTPEDSEQLMFYREDKKGQVLQEGINEAGAFSSWIAASTSYSNHGVPMIPFYIFYSMFGFQRIGDLAWAAGDSRARGFLLGGTAGRTTLNGEGLQHEDGHSHLLASVIPNCVAYDPTYGYEVAVIVQEGLRRMLAEQDDVFYYLTLMNENYRHPPMPEGAQEGILRGMYRVVEAAPSDSSPQCGCSARARPARGARRRRAAARDWGVSADASRVSPSCGARGWKSSAGTCIRRAAAWLDGEHPGGRRRAVVARPTMRFRRPDPAWVRAPYRVLGTDGFGAATMQALRAFFEVDRHHVALAALTSLAAGARSTPRPRQRPSRSYGSTPSGPRRGGVRGVAESRCPGPDIGDFADVRSSGARVAG